MTISVAAPGSAFVMTSSVEKYARSFRSRDHFFLEYLCRKDPCKRVCVAEYSARAYEQRLELPDILCRVSLRGDWIALSVGSGHGAHYKVSRPSRGMPGEVERLGIKREKQREKD